VSFPPYARSLLLQLGLLAVAGQFAWSQNACDLSRDGAVDVVDVQLAINMTLGLVSCTANIRVASAISPRYRGDQRRLGQACVTDVGASPTP
jgi:hypothetical protein